MIKIDSLHVKMFGLIILQLTVALGFAIYANKFDLVFINNIILAFALFIFTMLPLVYANYNVSLKKILIAMILSKAIIFLLVYFHSHHLSEGFYLNYMVGDDRKYTDLALFYQSDFSMLLKNEKNYYGLPYAAVLTLFTKFFVWTDLFRFVQHILLLISVYYVYRFILNTLKDKFIAQLSAVIYAFNPMLNIFSTFLFKDTILVFLLSYFLFVASENKLSIYSLVSMGAIVIVAYYIRPFLIPVFLLGLILFKVKIRLNSFRAVMSLGTIFILVLGLSYLLKDQLLRNLDLIALMDTRISNVTSILTSDIKVSFTQILVVAIFFLDLPPANFVNMETPWFSQEGLVTFPRAYNYALSIFMYIGIFFSLSRTNFNKNSFALLVLMFVMIVGMSLTGQVLSDRHKVMLYPLVMYFVAMGLKSSNARGYHILFGTVTTITVALQIYYSVLRFQSYGY
ncbi:hypothetical protein ACFSJ3_02100 [Corallincola platygyrae]|uniref:Glycosyltransferase RgtA/B/C/D-like domain-containing protein n=1 Tax=Corallincola platygyrae TaxID=1193278 RepID=A0ABW4XL92_9GAMM